MRIPIVLKFKSKEIQSTTIFHKNQLITISNNQNFNNDIEELYLALDKFIQDLNKNPEKYLK